MNDINISLIHATEVAIAPIKEAFAQHWPQAKIHHLLDDSLSTTMSSNANDDYMLTRIRTLLNHAASGLDIHAVLFTCSAFGKMIDVCKESVKIPVFKPDQAMIEEAIAIGNSIQVFATYPPAIDSITREIEVVSQELKQNVHIDTHLVEGALNALKLGDYAKHDTLIQESVASHQRGDVICFSQFSMASAATIARKVCAPTTTILTSPESSVISLKQALGHIKN